ncbi:glycoside hydrolase family 2 TIM barrel-domain containing protein [Botrimarina hoheduenensis]|uniref:Beta-galactosidase n=1 Tax=Botrimarina hoheduenensis TaxID=2528000 RepID=A0A5C5VPX9_9BACT|nr:glycoside hydrolase family 2 TIM barrel-domain containing protein [Botrimarina hoheduenensis]TWT40634.1 Beta-galactosidase [Botrimarina hoheduenensis]
MTNLRFGPAIALALGMACVSTAASERRSFNDAWRFHKGTAEGAEAADYDAGDWRRVTLPHDWAIEGPFDPKYNARTGGLPVHGTGWYRKAFPTPAGDAGQRVAIAFDGAMYDAHVWVNGQFVGNRPYGYIGFELDVTDALRRDGGDNLVAVRLQPKHLASRWYPGAGLYRNVWLNVRPAVHVPQWGVAITTPSVTDDLASVATATEVANHRGDAIDVRVRQTVLSSDGEPLTTNTQPLEIAAGETAEVRQRLAIEEPSRWDVESPYLYRLKTEVLSGELVIDSMTSRFGVRTVEFGSEFGFKLNGRPLRMQGVCLHHDLGPLGAAVNRRATERQLEIMKAMGVNAIRTSHNPPSPEQLELCDELGLLVLDEAFDCWRKPKVPNGYNVFFDEWHERDLRDMIRRDRNHPSVVLWSIGNEILEQWTKDGWKLARQLTAICHDEDPSRLVTAGFNGYPQSYDNKLAHEIDVVGLNYKPMFYPDAIGREPGFVIYGSETSSCVSSRGVYHLPIEAYETHPSLQVTSYDLIGPKWAYPPDIEFQQLDSHPSVFGEFVWTGFDYLGEPTPYSGRDNETDGYWNKHWPARSSYFGCVDLCGLPKDRFYLYQSQWTEAPMAHLAPHWNWEDRAGEPIPVYCYTNGDEAELFLNGRLLGRLTKGVDRTPVKVDCYNWPGGDLESRFRLRWDVPYEPGELRVVAYRGGEAVAEDVVHTAGPPAALVLKADRASLTGSDDLSFVTFQIIDAEGNVCPEAANRVDFTVEGPGRVVAVGNGDATSMAPFQATTRKAFSGMGMAIVGPAEEGSGAFTLQAVSEGLAPASVKIECRLR